MVYLFLMKKRIIISSIVVMLIFLNGCIQTGIIPPGAEKCEERPTECLAIYKPVCGSDGIEYSNACSACSNSSVEYYFPGKC